MVRVDFQLLKNNIYKQDIVILGLKNGPLTQKKKERENNLSVDTKEEKTEPDLPVGPGTEHQTGLVILLKPKL